MSKLPCKVHPAADIFPMMSPDEFEGLKNDIKTNGLGDPLVFWNNQLLDGRNRLSALLSLGMPWEKHRKDLKIEVDPLAYVLTHNLHRRHLDASQRAMVASKIRPMFDAAAKKRMSDGGKAARNGNGPEKLPDHKDARDAAGEALNVSGKLVDAATAVLETGNKELIALVEQGEVSVSKVAKQLKQDQDDAAAIVKRIKSGESSKPKKPTKREKARVWSELSAKLAAFGKLFEKHAQECDESVAVCEALDELTEKYQYYVRSVELD